MFATAVHFHPSLIFASNAGGYQSEAPYENPLYCYATSLARKYLAKVELNGSGKQSRLFCNGNNYVRKIFYSTVPGITLQLITSIIHKVSPGVIVVKFHFFIADYP